MLRFVLQDLDPQLHDPHTRVDAIRRTATGSSAICSKRTVLKVRRCWIYPDNYRAQTRVGFARLATSDSRATRRKSSADWRQGIAATENYAPQLMELHTLERVDGGYSQQDVIEVARAFTGWTIESPREKPEFYFDERLHDPDPKRVLGKKIKAGGIKDGEQVLDLLSKNPHTAHHISLELAQYFVSDDPPPALIARMAKIFQKSKGDIRAVMTTMIYSPEFWSRSAFRAKVKTPFELVASTVRAVGVDVDQPLQMAQWVSRIGEPLYQCLTPNGYSDQAASWVSTGSLLNRMNFAVALTTNKIRGAQVDINPLLGDDVAGNSQLALDRVETVFLAGQLSDPTRATLEKEATDPQILGAKLDDPVKQVNIGLITGLVLGSPEFQKR